MKHLPAFKAALAAVAGIVAGKYLEQYSLVFLSCAVALVLISGGWLLLRRERPASNHALAAYLALAFAFALHMSVNLNTLEEVRPGDYRIFSGTVDETPRDSSRPSILLTDCSGYAHGWHRIDGSLVLTPESRLGLMTGDRIIFKAKPGLVSDARNPGEFNLRNYYRLGGIAGRVFLRQKTDILKVRRAEDFGFRRNIIAPVRDYLREKITEFLKGDEAELARAMVLGERMGINRTLNENFMKSGTIHILAVSGLHIGFLAGILMTLASLLRIPRRYRFFLIAPVLIVYAFIVGMTPSVTRAVIMAIVVLFGLFLQRKSRLINSLGFAALIILVFSPSQFFSPGFQLSFAAVLSIAFFYERMSASISKSHPALVEKPGLNSVVSVSLLTISASLGTVPLVAYYFNIVSLIGIFTNLLVVPLAGIFISLSFTFLLFSFFFPWAASIYAAAAQIVGFSILGINSLAASFSLSSLRIGDAGMLFGTLYLVWLMAVFLFGKRSITKKSIFAVLLGANMIIWTGIFTHRDTARLYVLDVGQGDAIYVELPDGRNMLVDTGVKFGRYDAGARVIVPFLKKRGVDHLDYLIITHLHGDHIGGAVSVLRSLKVRKFVYPEQVSRSKTWINSLASVRALNIPAATVLAGTVLDSGLLYRIYVLHPNRKYVGKAGLATRRSFNDGSIVLKVCVGNQSILLTGDIESRVEHDLVGIYHEFLASRILKVGHHGSLTSSSREFLESVNPNYAVISVGAGNGFGHPSSEVLDRMKRGCVDFMRTDSVGAVCFMISPTESQIVRWR